MVKLFKNEYYLKNYSKLKEYYRKKYWEKQLAYNPQPHKTPIKFTKGKYIINFT